MRIQNENGEEKLANKGCASEKNYQHEFNPLGYSFSSTYQTCANGIWKAWELCLTLWSLIS